MYLVLFISIVIVPAEVDLITIVESLQPFMTHSDAAIRGKGIPDKYQDHLT